MTQSIFARGALHDARTVVLDEPLPVTSGRVEVVIRLDIDRASVRQSVTAFLRDLRVRQSQRGHVPMTAEEIQAQMDAERGNWGD